MVGGQLATRLDQGETANASADSGRILSVPYTGIERRQAPRGAAAHLVTHDGDSKIQSEAAAARISGLYARMPAMLSITDENRNVVMVSGNWLNLLGYSRDEVIGKPARQFLTPKSADYLQRVAIPQLEAQGQTEGVEVELVRKDGTALCVLASSRVEIDPVTGRRQMLTISMDLTERKRAEQAKNEAERLLRSIIDNAPLAVFVKDGDGRQQLINRRYQEWFGVTEAEIRGKTNAEIAPPEVAAEWTESDHAAVAQGKIVVECEPQLDLMDKAVERTLVLKFPIRDDNGKVVNIAGFILDITERVRAERALQQSEAHFRAMFENSSEFICVIDAGCNVRIANPSTEEVIGHRVLDIVGRPLTAIVHPDDVGLCERLLESISGRPGGTAQGEARVRAQDGTWRSIAFSARNAMHIPGIEGIFITGRDITQFKQLESQLSDARRLESIGALAAGVAHDFNNILGAVLGFSKFLVTDLDPAEPQHAYAQRIIAASERGRDLVQQIFSFSRAGRVERLPENLTALVEESAAALPALLSEQTELSVSLTPGPMVAIVNAAEIQQLVLNLAINARDALGKKGGTIEIDVAEISANHEDHRRLRYFEGRGIHTLEDGRREIVFGSSALADRFARIRVTDSGAGMAPETLSRAFDPFFTTKSRATGTGLGLATVRNIVSATGGACVIESALGRGTTVSVWLPLNESAAAEPGHQQADSPQLTGEGRVLVVEEEADVADAIAIGLNRLGYDAIAVNDPIQALQRFAKRPEEWKMVVSGQSMSAMTGLQLLAAMKRIRPSLGFILCSGSSDDSIERSALSGGASHFFRKPVGAEQLAEAIAGFEP